MLYFSLTFQRTKLKFIGIVISRNMYPISYILTTYSITYTYQTYKMMRHINRLPENKPQFAMNVCIVPMSRTMTWRGKRSYFPGSSNTKESLVKQQQTQFNLDKGYIDL